MWPWLHPQHPGLAHLCLSGKSALGLSFSVVGGLCGQFSGEKWVKLYLENQVSKKQTSAFYFGGGNGD